MKRITTIFLLTICLLAVGSWSYAQGKGKGCRQGTGGTGCRMNYVDKNGDGICDNAGSHNGQGRGKGHRLGPKDGTGKGAQRGSNFVDTDGDGVCDNRQQNQDKTE